MTNWKRVVILAGLAAFGASAAAGQNEPVEHPWKNVTDDQLLNPTDGDWVSYRRSEDVTAFSPLHGINASNVHALRPVWSYSMRDNKLWYPTPIAVNGMLFVSEGGRVVAFDAKTGDVIWIHERRFPADISISQANGRTRGVSVYRDKIYWATADAHLLTLDARTGKLVWDVQTGDYHTGEGHNHPPLIADGKVFLGHTGGERTAQGRFRAYDAETGALLWTVYTAPRPEDPGYETWSHDKFPPLGATPWHTASYDPQLKLVYFGTGQPTPWVEALRGPGDALYSNSILAVEADTGKIRWHFQVVPKDDFDRDSVFENMLVDLMIDGRKRKALIQTGKIGWGVVLDRETGEFLKAFRTAYENVILGWTKEGRPILDPAGTAKPEDIDSDRVFHICPSWGGARSLNSPSYSPLTRLYYMPINNSCMDAKVTSVDFEEGHLLTGAEGTVKLVPGYDYIGEFAAIDPATGTRAWTYRPPSGAAMSGSALATAGGIVFGGTVDRDFFALDAKTGKLLWQMRLSGDISGGPMTFETDGRQYVAVATGGRPGVTMAFGELNNVHLAEGSGTIWVFALPDKRDLQPPPRLHTAVLVSSSEVSSTEQASQPSTTTSAKSPERPALFTAAQAARGEEIFNEICSKCHVVADQTGESFRSKWGKSTLAQLFNLISVTMPKNAPGSLSKDDYVAVMAYMLQKSGYQAGSSELPADVTALGKMRLGGPLSAGTDKGQ